VALFRVVLYTYPMAPLITPDEQDLDARLRKVFPDIYEPEAREALIHAGHRSDLRAGQVFMEIGGYIRNIPLVLSGLLKLVREDEDGNEMLLYYLKPGETCAMSLTCCMNEARSSIRVSAEEDTEILALPARLMDEFTDGHRSWKNFVMLTYQRRFEELLHTIDGVAFQKLDVRIQDLLRERAKNSGSTQLTITHQDIAEQLNSSREVISRLLKRMERDGELKLGRQRIELIGPAWSR
jgi:CRP/FNR family transcriptional regulator